uniref:Uncharacterized protein n=1 Tax=Schistocephalus solidus TaxID=70667 RepID=A0A0X3PQV1_SCHSO
MSDKLEKCSRCELPNVAVVRRNGANSAVTAHSTRPGHRLRFNEAEMLTRGDNCVCREFLESSFMEPKPFNECNDLPNPYSVLSLSLAKAINHSRSLHANKFFNVNADEPGDRAIITTTSKTRDDISASNYLRAIHQTICAPEGIILDEREPLIVIGMQ